MDTCRLILNGTSLTHRWVAIQWLQFTQTSRVQADLQSIVDGVSAAWNTNIVPNVPNTVTLDQVTGVWITPGPSEILATNSTVRTGSLASPQLKDVSACYVFQWHISAYYRGGHPRSYQTGVADVAMTNGSDVSPSYRTALQTAALGYLNALNALTHGGITGTTLGTVSFQSGHAWRTPPIFRPFIGVSINSKIGTQRRRIHS